MDKIKKEQWKVLIRTVLLWTMGVFFIACGLSILPIFGIAAGAGLLWFGIYPRMKIFRRNDVNVLIGSVSDNYLEGRTIPVAILSATKERDGFDFDPGRVDPSSVRIVPGRVGPVDDITDPKIYARSVKDINDDGIPDLIVYFSGDSTGIHGKVGEVCVRAKTRDGERVFGCGELETGYESLLMRKLEYV